MPRKIFVAHIRKWSLDLLESRVALFCNLTVEKIIIGIPGDMIRAGTTLTETTHNQYMVNTRVIIT